MKKILYFTATWCAPCKALKPIIQRLNEEKKIVVEILDIDVRDNRNKAEQFGVRNVPTLVFLNKEKEYARTVGIQTESQILNNYNK